MSDQSGLARRVEPQQASPAYNTNDARWNWFNEGSVQRGIKESGYDAKSPVKPSLESLIAFEGYIGSENIAAALGFEEVGWGFKVAQWEMAKITAKGLALGLDHLTQRDWEMLVNIKRLYSVKLKRYALAHSPRPEEWIEMFFAPIENMSFNVSQNSNDMGPPQVITKTAAPRPTPNI